MEVSARRATGHDLGELRRLVSACVAGLEGQRGARQWLATAAPAPPAEAAELEAEAPNLPVWFAGCIDDAPVGIALAQPRSWPDGSLVLEIRLLYVEPDARDVGVGEALVDRAIELATALGAVAVESTALPGDRELKNLFERYGLVARAIIVHKVLGGS
jgi:GNAT superfamily N-acetyltransferase